MSTPSDIPASRWCAAVGAPLRRGLMWGVAFGALGAAVRYGLIEPDYFRNTCDVDVVPGWCWPRTLILLAFNNSVLGGASLLFGSWAVLKPGRYGPALGAIAFGTLGLALYNAGPASIGLVLGLIAVSRERV